MDKRQSIQFHQKQKSASVLHQAPHGGFCRVTSHNSPASSVSTARLFSDVSSSEALASKLLFEKAILQGFHLRH